MTADGGVPFYLTPANGSTAEVSQVVAAMKAQQKAAKRDGF